jgi:hypothetical protein
MVGVSIGTYFCLGSIRARRGEERRGEEEIFIKVSFFLESNNKKFCQYNKNCIYNSSSSEKEKSFLYQLND